MKKLPMLCLLLLIPALARAGEEPSLIVTVRGALVSDGKPVSTASFYLQPAHAQTAVQVGKDGKFEVKATATRDYVIDINAPGYAPVHRELTLDAKNNADLGTVTLDVLRKVKASAVVAPRGQLKAAPVQPLVLEIGACANVRAQDDSGCLIAFCVQQAGAVPGIDRWSGGGQFRTLGAVSLADALAKIPKGTFTNNDDRYVPFVKGETVIAEPPDQYCTGLVHIDDVTAAR